MEAGNRLRKKRWTHVEASGIRLEDVGGRRNGAECDADVCPVCLRVRTEGLQGDRTRGLWGRGLRTEAGILGRLPSAWVQRGRGCFPSHLHPERT